jgi:hypothetical protein
MNNPKYTQNLISDEMAELLASEGVIKKIKGKHRVIERFIMYGEQLRLKVERKYQDGEYRIDEV